MTEVWPQDFYSTVLGFGTKHTRSSFAPHLSYYTLHMYSNKLAASWIICFSLALLNHETYCGGPERNGPLIICT